jgi:ABC-2 type transport system permease protein
MDLRGALKAVRASAWVGWQVDSNWTEPFIFIGIQIVRPLASTMLFPFSTL